MNTLPTVADHEDEAGQQSVALAPLPFEGHAVATARALEALKSECEVSLMLMQFTPRAEPEVFASLSRLQASLDRAITSYASYSEIRSCRGQC